MDLLRFPHSVASQLLALPGLRCARCGDRVAARILGPSAHMVVGEGVCWRCRVRGLPR